MTAAPVGATVVPMRAVIVTGYGGTPVLLSSGRQTPSFPDASSRRLSPASALEEAPAVLSQAHTGHAEGMTVITF
jgi:deoxycytidylate deaminase